MAITLAFDVYGTLIDTAGVTHSLSQLVGDDAVHFSDCWRQKQLEYSFRRGLMEQYADFSVCTRDALEHTCQLLGHVLSDSDKQALLESYRVLPAFPEVESALESLKRADLQLYAFSNGKPDDLNSLLTNAGLIQFFNDTVSVHEIGSFKPSPKVYHHFMDRASSNAQESWLISSNPFDVLGAAAVEMNTAWIRRSEQALFDPWGITPTIAIPSLLELKQGIEEQTGQAV